MQVNCFNVTLPDGDKPNYVLLAINGETIEALKYVGGRYSVPETLSLDSLDPARVRVWHPYGLDEVRYEGIRAVACGQWTRWPYAMVHFRRLKEAVAQRIFNRRDLQVRRRLDVLRAVVKATFSGNDSISTIDLMTAEFGYRWAGHPAWEGHLCQLERHLDLLVNSGELEKHNQKYSLTGLALKTLEQSEDEDRKHTANLRVQLFLVVLAFASFVMAAAQAGLLVLPTLVDFKKPASVAICASEAVPQLGASAAVDKLNSPMATPTVARPPASKEATAAGPPSNARTICVRAFGRNPDGRVTSIRRIFCFRHPVHSRAHQRQFMCPLNNTVLPGGLWDNRHADPCACTPRRAVETPPHLPAK